MNADIELTIVLPAYLEEENLRILLPRLIETLTKMAVSHEVLVVDTREAMDFTQEVCLQHGVVYINREGGNHFGDAVRTGINHAQGKNIVFMDADGSHSPEFIPTMYQFVNEYDVVIASRYVKGGGTDNIKVLVWMSLVLNFLYSLILNLKCKDVSNSFKIYRSSLLKGLTLHCNNFDIVEEILFKIVKTNRLVRIKEVPFTFKQRMFGQTKRNLLLFIFTFIVTIIKLRFGR